MVTFEGHGVIGLVLGWSRRTKVSWEIIKVFIVRVPSTDEMQCRR